MGYELTNNLRKVIQHSLTKPHSGPVRDTTETTQLTTPDSLDSKGLTFIQKGHSDYGVIYIYTDILTPG